ncbi:MAG: endonuclease/exonuclease/phosphatase family protein [Alphaproteobacteria bacterium]|jgi:endonuclease/exonuclease/phosphatase (EEP) superfamily protein YafD|nr:endonuclease/exonuclease/phosphatase family protein [Alphaproteobacteria bacterium]MBU0803122.1 endonuclease/exonuclease/phosphatase family protein [Alphaproteobacteria bacterium]MBU0873810.1 endonuclease/exonuclease/phosphatase family protein [Alphaproteobacteria bacterium]MBU1400690.1 endonuclease/exonuclease/phosphatase family protein [Alphaproteobacteria bacterium]MBU1590563.1 endonuclease/exonuclease/phosphatase family protein [Alphaproteobacteria bacterium]
MDRRPVLGATALALVVLISLPLVAGFFGRLHPAFDSFAHFRIHLAILLVACAVPLLLGAFRREALMAIAFGLAAITTVTGAAFLPGLRPVHAAFAPRDGDEPVYRLLQINLRFDNREPEKVLSLIARERPDVVTLNEVSAMWAKKIALLEAAYPYRLVCTMDNYAGGVTILSLRPFAQGAEGRCIDGGTFATATIDFGGRPLDIAAMHLHWPWPFDQAEQVAGMTADLAGLPETVLLAGDLNATPWSAAAQQIAEAGGLRQVGPIGATWHYRLLPEFLRFTGLPIDQVFAKGNVRVHSARRLEPVGSDHLPVLVEFSLDPPRRKPVDPAQSITAALAPGGT